MLRHGAGALCRRRPGIITGIIAPIRSMPGDLPPLFVGNGRAWGAVLTTRFRVEEVIGRTVIIHSQADDFRTQPAGDSGSRIACGVIRPVKQ